MDVRAAAPTSELRARAPILPWDVADRQPGYWAGTGNPVRAL